MEAVPELVEFLGHNSPEVRRVAVANVLSLTGSEEGRAALKAADAPKFLVPLLGDVLAIAHDAIKSLINMSNDSDAAATMVLNKVIPRLVENILDSESKLADLCAMLLSNICRTPFACSEFLQVSEAGGALKGLNLAKLVRAFKLEHKHGEASLDWLASVFANVSNVQTGRAAFIQNKKLLPQLLPFIEHPSVIRRGGVVSVIRNCLFDEMCHAWLMDEGELNILPHLLRPLMDDAVYPQDEMIGMPLDLRVLPDGKEREPDAEVRKMLVESLTLLAKNQESLEFLKKRKVYVIIREAHKVEADEEVDKAMFNLVDILLVDTVVDDLSGASTAVGESEGGPSVAVSAGDIAGGGGGGGGEAGVSESKKKEGQSDGNEASGSVPPLSGAAKAAFTDVD